MRTSTWLTVVLLVGAGCATVAPVYHDARVNKAPAETASLECQVDGLILGSVDGEDAAAMKTRLANDQEQDICYSPAWYAVGQSERQKHGILLATGKHTVEAWPRGGGLASTIPMSATFDAKANHVYVLCRGWFKAVVVDSTAGEDCP